MKRGQRPRKSVVSAGLRSGLSVEHPLLEQREAGTAVPAAFEQCAFRHLPFGLALIPRELESSEHGYPVLPQLGYKGAELWHARAERLSDPVVKPLLRMRGGRLAQEEGESLQQLHRALDLQGLQALDR